MMEIQVLIEDRNTRKVVKMHGVKCLRKAQAGKESKIQVNDGSGNGRSE